MAQDDNLRMLTEKHNDGKLAIAFFIVETGLIAVHFCQKIKWHHYYSQLVVLW